MSKPTSVFVQLSDNAQLELVNDFLNKSNISVIDAKASSDKTTQAPSQVPISITSFIDGRELACPQPLLKTKIALRNVASKPVHDGFIYMIATDPNSQVDLKAFAKQNEKQLLQWQSDNSTIFHFLIQY